MNAIVNVTGLQVRYGVIEAVKGIDLTLEQGEITALLGANGAGKSTTLLALSGLVKPAAGSIRFDNFELTRLAPTWNDCFSCFHSCASGSMARRETSRAASSKCWRSPAR